MEYKIIAKEASQEQLVKALKNTNYILYNPYGNVFLFELFGYQFSTNFKRKKCYRLNHPKWMILKMGIIEKIWMILTKQVKKIKYTERCFKEWEKFQSEKWKDFRLDN